MPGGIIHDYEDAPDPRTGKVSQVSAGYGGSATTGDSEGSGAGMLINSGIFGQGFGIAGSRGGASAGLSNEQGRTSAEVSKGVTSSAEGPGYITLKDLFLIKNVPIYNTAISRHKIARDKVMKPYAEKMAVLVALRDKAQSQTGFWAGFANFITDPVALLGIAGIVVGAGSGAGLAAKEALKDLDAESSAEDAVKKLNAAIKSLQADIDRRVRSIGEYRGYTATELHSDFLNGKIPKGVVWHPIGSGPTGGIVGTSEQPEDFISWFKHKKKMLDQRGIHPVS